jgi:hypothetical protein
MQASNNSSRRPFHTSLIMKTTPLLLALGFTVISLRTTFADDASGATADLVIPNVIVATTSQSLPSLPGQLTAPLSGQLAWPLPGQIVQPLPGQIVRALPGQIVQSLPHQLSQPLPNQIVQSISGEMVASLPGQVLQLPSAAGTLRFSKSKY